MTNKLLVVIIKNTITMASIPPPLPIAGAPNSSTSTVVLTDKERKTYEMLNIKTTVYILKTEKDIHIYKIKMN